MSTNHHLAPRLEMSGLCTHVMKLLKYIMYILPVFFPVLCLMTDICYHIDMLYTYMV